MFSYNDNAVSGMEASKEDLNLYAVNPPVNSVIYLLNTYYI